MNILVLCEAYPDDSNPYQLMYVHTRLLEYVKRGLNVSVLSFRANTDYEIDGIKVIKEIKVDYNDFDLIISHAPNVRNHFRYILKYLRSSKIVFFIHGHEALNVTKYYPGRYDGVGYSLARKILERIKLFLFKLFLFGLKKNIHIVYVSQWMKNHFYKNVKPIATFKSEVVINNSVGQTYILNSWDSTSVKEFDFVTIRPLNEKKYAVDIVLNLAIKNPNKTFAIYGKGNVFDYIEKPANVLHFDEFLFPTDIVNVLNKSKVALMPTRLDAQGVMVCEMATYGIPTITSDIDVCREMFLDFNNVQLIGNDEFGHLGDSTLTSYEKNNKYDIDNTIVKEIDYINSICEKGY